jgi:cytochrome c oxidase subunit 2
VIDITAKRFEFTPNQINIKRGEPVILRLKSLDVTHGFFSRQLKIDGLIEPGKTLEVSLTPQSPGTYTVICHHFCGVGHGNMKMTIVVE